MAGVAMRNPNNRLPSLALGLLSATSACVGAAPDDLDDVGDGAQTSALTAIGIVRPPVALRAWPVHLAARAGAFYAVMNDGSVRVWGSGPNLGDGAASATLTAPTRVANLDGVVSLAPAPDHVCALRSDGAARCWGEGWTGQLGNGTYLVANSATPVAVQGAVRFTSLTSIDNTTCGVSRDADKRVYCWGANPGLAGFAPSSVPAGTSLTGAERVFGPGLFIARIANPYGGAGLLMTWGPGDFLNVTRRGVTGAVATPTSMPQWTVGSTAFPLADVQSGASHACAVDTTGWVACVGGNAHGELGNWSTVSSAVPTGTSPPFTQAASISVGLWHTCAVRRDGALYCWGSNQKGQLGDPRNLNYIAAPNAVPGLTNVVEVAAGDDRTCALRSDSTVWCWGGANGGSAGLLPALSPVRVAF